jgi:hypothetical protein
MIQNMIQPAYNSIYNRADSNQLAVIGEKSFEVEPSVFSL